MIPAFPHRYWFALWMVIVSLGGLLAILFGGCVLLWFDGQRMTLAPQEYSPPAKQNPNL